MSPENEAIGIVIADGFRLQEWKPADLGNSLVKRGVIVRLSMGWFGRRITRKSQERTKELHDYRVYLQHQSVRSMKLPLGTYSTETSAAVGAWVLLERNDKDQTGGAVGGGRQIVSWEIQKQAEKNRQSITGESIDARRA